MIATNPASTLGEAIRCVRDLLAAMPSQLELPPEQRIVVTIGLRPTSYTGAPPRVHFWPDDRGTWGDPPAGQAGKSYIAGVAQGCTVYVWGAGDADDFAHYDAADELADIVMNAIMRAARGRVTGASFGDDSRKAAEEEQYGQAYAFRFVYTRGVQKSAEIAAIPSNPVGGPQPSDPDRPPGAPASTVLPLAVAVVPPLT